MFKLLSIESTSELEIAVSSLVFWSHVKLSLALTNEIENIIKNSIKVKNNSRFKRIYLPHFKTIFNCLTLI